MSEGSVYKSLASVRSRIQRACAPDRRSPNVARLIVRER